MNCTTCGQYIEEGRGWSAEGTQPLICDDCWIDNRCYEEFCRYISKHDFHYSLGEIKKVPHSYDGDNLERGLIIYWAANYVTNNDLSEVPARLVGYVKHKAKNFKMKS